MDMKMTIKRLDYNYDNSRMGTAEMSYDRLYELFGPPTKADENEKVSMFWAFEVGNFKFSIHNYGNTERQSKDIKNWSVGSYSSNGNISREMKQIFVGGVLSGITPLEQGIINTVFNLHKLDQHPPYMQMLYSE